MFRPSHQCELLIIGPVQSLHTIYEHLKAQQDQIGRRARGGEEAREEGEEAAEAEEVAEAEEAAEVEEEHSP